MYMYLCHSFYNNYQDTIQYNNNFKQDYKICFENVLETFSNHHIKLFLLWKSIKTTHGVELNWKGSVSKEYLSASLNECNHFIIKQPLEFDSNFLISLVRVCNRADLFPENNNINWHGNVLNNFCLVITFSVM